MRLASRSLRFFLSMAAAVGEAVVGAVAIVGGAVVVVLCLRRNQTVLRKVFGF